MPHILAIGLFFWGSWALPGKVCANTRPPSIDVVNDVPPCHRTAPQTEKATPCDQMVCCLVPVADRSFVAAPEAPAPVPLAFASRMRESVIELQKSVPVVDRLFHPPPGSSAGFLFAFSLRAPPARV